MPKNGEVREHIAKIVLPGGLQLSRGSLADGQSFPPWHVHGLDLLHRHAAPCDIHRATVAVLVVFAVPDQHGLSRKERMGSARPPADEFSKGGSPPSQKRGSERILGQTLVTWGRSSIITILLVTAFPWRTEKVFEDVTAFNFHGYLTKHWG